jgi:hypothetical protein
MAQLTVKEVDRMRYRPTKTAEEFLGDLRASLGLGDKATAARLAIARSAVEPVPVQVEVESALDGVERGMPIEGIHLFGENSDLWATIVANTVDWVCAEGSQWRNLVEFHWQRGASLLQADYEDANRDMVDFIFRQFSTSQ